MEEWKSGRMEGWPAGGVSLLGPLSAHALAAARPPAAGGTNSQETVCIAGVYGGKACVRWRDGERVHHPLRWRHGSTEKIGLVCAPGKPLREFGAGPVLVELVPAVGQGEGTAANSRKTGIGEQRRGNLAAASSPCLQRSGW